MSKRSTPVRLLLLLLFATAIVIPTTVVAQDMRPPPSERKFNSTAVENLIVDYTSRMKDPELASYFGNCFPNTLDTTVEAFKVENGVPDTFIITGDIPAMWYRDSTNQVAPYWPLLEEDENLKLLMCGLVRRQAKSILHDPYANAVNYEPTGGPWENDNRVPEMTPEVFEGKYELDSLAAILKLAVNFFNWTRDATCFDDEWLQAMRLIVDTITIHQASTMEELADPPYLFARETQVATDTLMLQRRGPPAKRCGLSKCAFRPSDDAVTLPFLIPANAMAAVELERLSNMLNDIKRLRKKTSMSNGWWLQDPDLAEDAYNLSQELREAIATHAIVTRDGVKMYAYEVDGYGSNYMMDDANIPSLLSFPYIGFADKNDEIYQNTRNFVLSSNNPYYFEGKDGKGVGGPHIGMNYVWPMAISIRALTSDSDEEIMECLEMLKRSTAGTGFMHESFWADDATNYTRSWFAWANSIFSEVILTLARERPHLIFNEY